ncbi:unnamed protein product [Prorocentrum cordatum]|uniref:RNA-editing substrate-binding complex 6 protein domain-containing protein n=1 Tax=Prorocentrum cordatum TaxID=2364126 RepID=A0ABN9Y5E0_9DINO|nr:unnamed protein product [Polarella glacialis]
MSGNRARRRGGRADGAGAEDGHDGGSHGPSRRDGTGDGGGGKRGGKSEHARRGPDEDNWRSSDPASGPSDGRRGVGGSQRKAYAGGDEPPRGGGRERGERGKGADWDRPAGVDRGKGGKRARDRRDRAHDGDLGSRWGGRQSLGEESGARAGGEPVEEAVEAPDASGQGQGQTGEESATRIAIFTRQLMELRRDTCPSAQHCSEIIHSLKVELSRPDAMLKPDELGDLTYVLGKLYTLGKLSPSQTVQDVLQLLACAASNDASRLSPHGISNLVVGFANLAPMNVRSENLMPVLASEVVDKISAFESSHLSQTSWAFAKCSLWNDVLVSTLGSECIKKMDTFSAHSLSHLSWAMAQWATTDQELRDALVARVKERVHDLAPNPLATMTSSFASLQVKDPLLYQAISMAVREKIHSFKATDLATMVNAFAKAGIADEAMLEAAAGELLGKLPGGLRPAEMCDVAWAFSQTKGQFSPAPLMGAISDEAFQRLPSFQSQDVANLLWSLAVSQVHHKPLMSEIGNMVANNMERYTAQHLASIARAYGALLLKHTRFMELLPRHVHVSLQNQAQNPNASVEPFKASHLSNIAFAFATLKVPCEALMKYMAPTIAHNIEELRPMFLSRCARAYRALSVHCPDLMAAVVRESTRKLQTSPKDFATRDLRRVVDSLFASGAIRRGAAMETELAERMRKVSDRFCGVYSGGAVVPVDDCRSLMEASKDLECSLAGTPMLISSLHICVPSRDFMRRCFAQTWKSFDGAMGAHLAERGGEYTAVEMDVCVGPGGQRLHDWIVRCKGHRGPVTGGDEGRPLPRLVQFLPFSLFRSSPAQCIHMPSFYSSPVSSHVSFVSSSSPFPFPFSSFLSSSSSSSSSSSTCGGT